MVFMQIIMVKLRKPADTVLGAFAGTFATTKACLLLPKHRKFIGGDVSKECVEAALPYVVNTFALPVHNPLSYIEGNDEVRQSAEVVMDTMARFSARRRRDVWEVTGVYIQCCDYRSTSWTTSMST